MKTMFLSVVLVTVAAALTPAATVNPNFGSTFRSDTSLRFMRGNRKQDPLEQAQQGPNADSKKAQEAAAKVVDKSNAEAKAADAKETTPVEAVAEAAESVTDAIADGVKDLQKGPNADSKKAQKAAEKVVDGQAGQEKAAPKEGEKKPAEAAAEEPEDKEVASMPGCKNSPKGWADSKGNDCEDYAEGQWCNRHGGTGDAWLDEWGTIEERATKGKSALQVCCVCGGGVKEDTEEASAPGAAPGPAAAASPAPAISGPILGTKAGRPMQSQGYSGELVVHVDQETMTDDWGQEFGPRAGHRDVKSICADHPGNEWCLLHGYYDTRESAAVSFKCPVAILLVALAFWS